MSLTDNGNDMVMPVAPMYGNNGGFGFGGNDGWWAILFLFAMMGGWGNGFGGYGGGGAYEFPWLLNGQAGINANTNAGFDNAAVGAQLNGIQSSISNGFQNAEVSACNRAMDSMQTAYGNQIASMNQSFANSQALDNRLSDLAMGLQNCCCENRAGLADVKYTIATEACNNRATSTANTQAILDKLCQLELDTYKNRVDEKNDTIAQLRSQLQFSNLQASQTEQTAQLRASQATTANQLVSELRSCPIPSQPVYGNQPIFTCNSNSCGCGAV